jgi:hypothetical protein
VRLTPKNGLVGQPVGKELNHDDDEPFELTQEIEAQVIGNLLPDDDDLLSGVLDNVGYPALANNRDDIDDDIFSTGGGLELEADENNKLLKLNGGGNNGQSRLNGLLYGETSYGEHPSRTLFVRNMNSNVEDSELKLLFEVSLHLPARLVPSNTSYLLILCSSFSNMGTSKDFILHTNIMVL